MLMTKLAVSPLERKWQAESQIRPKPFKSNWPVNYDDVYGLTQVKEKMDKIFIRRPLRSEFLLDFPLTKEREKSPAVLLFGPPGVGKTHFMMSLAAQYKVSAFWMQPAEILSKWEGQTEKNIFILLDAAKKAAEECENGMAIICIDHADGFLGKAAYPNFKNTLLAAIDGPDSSSKVVWIAATHIPDDLDPKFFPCFTEKIFLQLPDSATRKMALERGFASRKLKLDRNLCEELVKKTKGFTFREVKFLLMDIGLIKLNRLWTATHFKKVDGPNGEMWEIASPRDPEAEARSWDTIGNGLISNSVPVFRRDIRHVVSKFKPTHTDEAMDRNLEFNFLHNGYENEKGNETRSGSADGQNCLDWLFCLFCCCCFSTLN